MDSERANQEADCYEVPVNQTVRHFQHILGRRDVERPHQFLYRSGGEEVVAREGLRPPGCGIGGLQCPHLPALGDDPLKPAAGTDLPAFLFDVACDLFPHLSRAELGVEELFDQRGLGILLPDAALTALKRLPQGVNQRRPD